MMRDQWDTHVFKIPPGVPGVDQAAEMMVNVPNKPKTPLRNVRIDDELWHSAKTAAASNGETVSDVIRRSLQTYIERDGRAS